MVNVDAMYYLLFVGGFTIGIIVTLLFAWLTISRLKETVIQLNDAFMKHLDESHNSERSGAEPK